MGRDWENAYWNQMMRQTVRRITGDEIDCMARTLAEDRGDS